MGCGCNKGKQFGNRVLVKVVAFSQLPKFMLGAASKTAYGRRKDGDAIRVYAKDIDANPEWFQRIEGAR